MEVEDYKKLLKHHFYSFVRFSFNVLEGSSKYNDNWHIDVLCDYASKCENKSINRLIVNLPPRSLKSFILSICLPAWILGRNPSANILCISESQQLTDELSDLFLKLVKSKRYQSLFPKVDFIVKNKIIETQFGGNRKAKNIYSNLAGVGADYIIIDDPINPSKSQDENHLNEIIHQFNHNIVQRLNNKDGVIILAMQRLHEDDICARLLSETSEWDLLSISALATKDEEWHLPFDRVHKRKKWEPIDAKINSLDDLKKIKNSVGHEVFSTQYLQCTMKVKYDVVNYPNKYESFEEWAEYEPEAVEKEFFLRPYPAVIMPEAYTEEQLREIHPMTEEEYE